MFGAYDNYFLPRSFFILELFSAVLLKVENGWRRRVFVFRKCGGTGEVQKWTVAVGNCEYLRGSICLEKDHCELQALTFNKLFKGKNLKEIIWDFGFNSNFFHGNSRNSNFKENLKREIRIKVIETLPWDSFLAIFVKQAVQKRFLKQLTTFEYPSAHLQANGVLFNIDMDEL